MKKIQTHKIITLTLSVPLIITLIVFLSDFIFNFNIGKGRILSSVVLLSIVILIARLLSLVRFDDFYKKHNGDLIDEYEILDWRLSDWLIIFIIQFALIIFPKISLYLADEFWSGWTRGRGGYSGRPIELVMVIAYFPTLLFIFRSFILRPIRNEKEIIRIKRRAKLIEYINENKLEKINYLQWIKDDVVLQKDKGIILDAVKSNLVALYHADKSLKKDRNFVLEVVKIEGVALRFADESLTKDRNFVLEAVKSNGVAFSGADESFKKDREIVLEAVKSSYGFILEYADESLKKDRDFVLEAVKIDRCALEYADESLKKDRDFVLEAVKIDGCALEYADESFKKDREIVLLAIQCSQGHALEFADSLLKRDREIVMFAVQNCKCGKALKFADESLQNDPEILNAIKESNN